MLKEQDRTEEVAKQPAPAPTQAVADRKPYITTKLTVHGGLGQITAGSGSKSSYHSW